MAGLSATGFLAKLVEEILTEIQSAQRSTINPALNNSPASFLGDINGIVAEQIAQQWEVMQDVYASQSLTGATGRQLDHLGANVNATRLPAVPSAVSLLLNLNDGTVVPTGSIVSVGADGPRFVTLADADNSAGALPANIAVNAQSIDLGPVVAPAGTIDTIQTAVSGFSANAGITSANAEPYVFGLGDTLDIVVDRGATQTIVFTGAETTANDVVSLINTTLTGAQADNFNAVGFVRIESFLEGPGTAIQVAGGTANVALGFSIAPITAMNQLDADLGANIESDSAFRSRIVALRAATAGSSADGIRAAILQVPNVVDAIVLTNRTAIDNTGIGRLPPHSVEVVVDEVGAAPIDPPTLAAAIFARVSGGIQAFGNTVINVPDDAGFLQPAGYTLSADEDVFVDVTCNVDTTKFASPADAKAAIAAAVVAEGNLTQMSQEVIFAKMRCSPFDADGVTDIASFTMDIVDGSTGTVNISPSNIRNRLVFDTSRVDVTTIPANF